MSILLVRHGEAVSEGPDGDAPRFLSSRGRIESLAVGLAMKAAGLAPASIVTSPLVRAVQTAEILAHALGYTRVVSSDSGLVPNGDPSLFVRRLPPGSALSVVVCHEPIIRGIAALLANQSSYPSFKTSGAVLFGDGPGPRAAIARFDP